MGYKQMVCRGFQNEEFYVSCSSDADKDFAVYVAISSDGSGKNICLSKKDALSMAYMILTELGNYPTEWAENYVRERVR